jgi:hypothetical protein
MSAGYFKPTYESFGQNLAKLLGCKVKKPEKIGKKPRFCPDLDCCARKNDRIVLKICMVIA